MRTHHLVGLVSAVMAHAAETRNILHPTSNTMIHSINLRASEVVLMAGGYDTNTPKNSGDKQAMSNNAYLHANELG